MIPMYRNQYLGWKIRSLQQYLKRTRKDGFCGLLSCCYQLALWGWEPIGCDWAICFLHRLRGLLLLFAEDFLNLNKVSRLSIDVFLSYLVWKLLNLTEMSKKKRSLSSSSIFWRSLWRTVVNFLTKSLVEFSEALWSRAFLYWEVFG